MEMIEKVARAIFEVCSVDGVTLPWESISENSRALHKDWAKAAIEALREPTPEMLDPEDVSSSWKGCPTCGGLREGYELMIDAALSPSNNL
jgi:hypothetical protein